MGASCSASICSSSLRIGAAVSGSSENINRLVGENEQEN
jgi:hypothetical protein